MENLIKDLRALYERYGYARYKMSKFEEYDLYARNKDFLLSENIITFTDTNGRLMALKPDMTLSIVRSSRPVPGSAEKVYYKENVYRVSPGARGFREIMQIGLECIGDIDDYCIGEVLLLAAKSLKAISPDCALKISHMGIVSEIADRVGLTGEAREKALKCVGEKNTHELAALCDDPEPLKKLIAAAGAPEEVFPVLEALGCNDAYIRELKDAVETLRLNGADDPVRIDFSVVNAMNYYSGIVFRGFVSGVPAAVLSGGRYDRLMRKMGKNCGAIGFAVYPDQLERLYADDRKYDVDAVLLYSDGTDPVSVSRAVRRLTDMGISVSAQKSLPEKLRYRQVIRLGESGVSIVEDNA